MDILLYCLHVLVYSEELTLGCVHVLVYSEVLTLGCDKLYHE